VPGVVEAVVHDGGDLMAPRGDVAHARLLDHLSGARADRRADRRHVEIPARGIDRRVLDGVRTLVARIGGACDLVVDQDGEARGAMPFPADFDAIAEERVPAVRVMDTIGRRAIVVAAIAAVPVAVVALFTRVELPVAARGAGLRLRARCIADTRRGVHRFDMTIWMVETAAVLRLAPGTRIDEGRRVRTDAAVARELDSS
jgi:hypothetical protein